MQIYDIYLNSSLVLILTFVAEYMLKSLKNATDLFKQETNDATSAYVLDIQSSDNKRKGAASSYSFRLSSVGGGLIWILVYVLLWVQIGVFLNHLLVIFIAVDFPIYIVLLAIAFYRGTITVGKAENARTDRRYKLRSLKQI